MTREDATEAGTFRRWGGLVAVYLSMPLALLACGGDAGWWQAWVYSVLIVVLGLGGHVWAERRHPGLIAERQNKESMKNAKPWDKVLAPLMALSIGYPMVIVPGLEHRLGGSLGFPLWVNMLGFALIAAGYAFAVWAMAENRFFSSVVRIQTDRGHAV